MLKNKVVPSADGVLSVILANVKMGWLKAVKFDYCFLQRYIYDIIMVMLGKSITYHSNLAPICEGSVKRQSSLIGFTLLELSIVMVIIGLIIGGITVGQDMIRSAELNSVVSNFQKYQTAVNAFKLKYSALPGDMDNASSYWPTCDATPANCDGDNDGLIQSELAWLHLSLSEIIPGSYPVAALPFELGTEMPESSIAGKADSLTSATVYGSPQQNWISIGG